MGRARLGRSWRLLVDLEVSCSVFLWRCMDANIGFVGGENVVFSSRCQLLVSKLGRSSKPSPRFIVVVCRPSFLIQHVAHPFIQTEKAVYLCITHDNNGQVQTSLERKIALVTIKSLAMSNLRDDWLVRPISLFTDSDQEANIYI